MCVVMARLHQALRCVLQCLIASPCSGSHALCLRADAVTVTGTREFGNHASFLPYTMFTHTGRFAVATNTSMLMSVCARQPCTHGTHSH